MPIRTPFLHNEHPQAATPLRAAWAAAAVWALTTAVAQAQTAATPDTHSAHAGHATATAPAPGATTATDDGLSDAEVLRWDARTGRTTLRHGPIRNLDMPPMTMVFRVPDAALAARMQAGTKIRFKAAQQQGAYVLTHVEPAP
ncbi:MAG: copper-binding protein [Burkholderiaceae bacterium]